MEKPEINERSYEVFEPLDTLQALLYIDPLFDGASATFARCKMEDDKADFQHDDGTFVRRSLAGSVRKRDVATGAMSNTQAGSFTWQDPRSCLSH